jgi:Fic family protein
LDDASRALARLDGLAALIENKGLVTRPLLTREAMESARLEGTHTHIAGLLRQEAGDTPDDPTEMINNQEVINYSRASWRAEQWLAEGRPITAHLIRALHRELLVGTRGENRHPGDFRAIQVLIGAQGDTPEGARFVPPPPEYISPAMDNLMAFLEDSGPYPPLVAAGIAHYQFETIHPFEDGNGRLGRLLIPLHLAIAEASTQPIVYLSPYFESKRDQYLQLLKEVSTRNAWVTWLSFFLEAVRIQANDGRDRVERIQRLQQDYHGRAMKVQSKIPALVVGFIMQRVIVTVREVAKYANCQYHTARAALETLQVMGIVEPVPDSQPQRWWATELIDEVYK